MVRVAGATLGHGLQFAVSRHLHIAGVKTQFDVCRISIDTDRRFDTDETGVGSAITQQTVVEREFSHTLHG